MNKRSPHLQPEDVTQSVQVLRYRGVFYIRKLRSSHPKQTNTEVVHLPNDSTQLNVSQRNYPMPIQRLGLLYKLYCMGWKNGSLNCFSFLQHWLLSIFLHYRQGYSEGSAWRQQHRLASLATQIKQHDRDF